MARRATRWRLNIELTFAPTQIEPMGADSYQLTSRSNEGDVVWSYTPGRGVYFVPVTPAESGKQAESNGLAQRRRR